MLGCFHGVHNGCEGAWKPRGLADCSQALLALARTQPAGRIEQTARPVPKLGDTLTEASESSMQITPILFLYIKLHGKSAFKSWHFLEPGVGT